jgi:hypothetical protein
MPDTAPPSTRQLVLVPALIALGVTIVRLVGELQHGDARFFNRAGGGAGAIVGISWLPLLFGVYFAVRLVRAGEGPASKGRAMLMPVIALVVTAAAIFAAFKSGASQNAQILAVCVASLLGGWIASLGWRELGKVSFAYALASRIPVAVLMYFAIAGKWGTHYDALPPNFPAMSPAATWALVGVLPQMTLWIGFTLLPACLLGGITAAVMGGGRRNAVANAA